MTLPLASLGDRILICGPSGSGKSSLAAAIAAARGLPVIHLDQLRFVPGSQWVERPNDDFAADIATAAAGESWIIEGNYFRWIDLRLARATGIVLLDGSRLANYLHFLKRCWFDRDRAGRLPGAADTVNWKMTRWILWDEPRRRPPKRATLKASGLPLVECRSTSDLNRLYAAWKLSRT